MSLSIRQDANYVDRDYWKWSVWLEGPSNELDEVDHVMYVLHSTYIKPVREIHDRASNFRLDTSGWGTFTIRAKVVSKAGREEWLKHDLILLHPDGTPTTA
jgi:transcription initiation factor IIF auxiliary subunit